MPGLTGIKTKKHLLWANGQQMLFLHKWKNKRDSSTDILSGLDADITLMSFHNI